MSSVEAEFEIKLVKRNGEWGLESMNPEAIYAMNEFIKELKNGL